MAAKIGLVGGLGPLSTIDYYTGLVDRFHKDFGLESYPEIVIDSISLKDFLDYSAKNDITAITRWICHSIDNLKAAGATFGAICSNTPHLYQNEIFNGASVEMISIVDSTLRYIKEKGHTKVLILGTPLTMGKGLYDKKMPSFGITPIVPSEEDRNEIGRIIFPNLENGIIIPEDKKKFISIINKYITNQKVDAVLLGCTELPLIIKEKDINVPLINTTEIHINAIYERYVSELQKLIPDNKVLKA